MCLAVAIGVLFQRPYRSLYTRFGFLLSLFLWHGAAFVFTLARSMAVYSEPSGLLIPPTLILFFAELMRDRSRYMQTLIRSSLALSFLLLGDPHPAARHLHRVPARALRHRRRSRCPEASSTISQKPTRRQSVLPEICTLRKRHHTVWRRPSDSSKPAPALGHAVTFWVYFPFSIVARRLMNMVELLGKAAVVGVLTLFWPLSTQCWFSVGQEQQGLWLFNTIVASFVI